MSGFFRQYRQRRRERLALPPQRELMPVMTAWFNSDLGRALYAAQKQHIQAQMARTFGYHILQISCSADTDLIDSSPAGHKLRFMPEFLPGQRHPVALAEALPLETESVDTVVLHHALDFTVDNHRLLREATRVIISGGRLLIIGFNPLSLWGAARVMHWHRKAPWNARFVPSSRLVDWLELLEFHVEQVSHGGYLLPLGYNRLLRQAGWLERAGTRFNNPLGAFYVITACKQRMPMTPLPRRWPRLPAPVLGRPAAEPAGMRHRDTQKRNT